MVHSQTTQRSFVLIVVNLTILPHILNIVFADCKVMLDKLFPPPTHQLYVRQTLHQLIPLFIYNPINYRNVDDRTWSYLTRIFQRGHKWWSHKMRCNHHNEPWKAQGNPRFSYRPMRKFSGLTSLYMRCLEWMYSTLTSSCMANNRTVWKET